MAKYPPGKDEADYLSWHVSIPAKRLLTPTLRFVRSVQSWKL